MLAKKYKTADVSTNFTDIRVKLQKRDLVKIGLVVALCETLLRWPLSRKMYRTINEKIDEMLPDDMAETFREMREKRNEN